jgi:hypothetical protein
MATEHDTLAIDRLSAEDVRILGLETRRVAGHTLKVTVLDPDTPPLELADLRARVAARIEALPRLTERLDHAPDGGLVWAPDPAFDLDRHVRERAGATDSPRPSGRRCRSTWTASSRCGRSSWWAATPWC